MERITAWAENNGVTCYRIFDVGNQKRCERDTTSVNDAVAEIAKDYSYLPDGKYYIKGMKNHKDDRGAVRYDFQIGSTQTGSNTMNLTDIQRIKEEAREEARKEFQYEMLDKRVTELERQMKVLIEVVKDLSDGDGDNDAKAENMLTMLSNAKENFDGAKDLLKDFKL